jgi:hypothetical protein
MPASAQLLKACWLHIFQWCSTSVDYNVFFILLFPFCCMNDNWFSLYICHCLFAIHDLFTAAAFCNHCLFAIHPRPRPFYRHLLLEGTAFFGTALAPKPVVGQLPIFWLGGTATSFAFSCAFWMAAPTAFVVNFRGRLRSPDPDIFFKFGRFSSSSFSLRSGSNGARGPTPRVVGNSASNFCWTDESTAFLRFLWNFLFFSVAREGS